MASNGDSSSGRLSSLTDSRRELLRRLLADRRGETIPRRPADMSIVPASHGQRRLWFMSELDPTSPVYQISEIHPVAAPLEPAIVERSVREVVRRHEALRTTFALRDGEPVQVISDAGRAEWEFVDLSGAPRDARERRGREIAARDAQRAFDLGNGPLLRVTLVRLDPAEHVLLVTIHHIIADAWSMDVLLRDLDETYDALAHGRPPELPPLPVQYADYTLWQEKRLEADAVARSVQYWRERLTGAERLVLPGNVRASGRRTWQGAREFFTLDERDLPGIDALARRANATRFMVLLAVFNVLMHRYTGERDIVVASPVSGRHLPETEGLIGFFLNTICLRTDVGGNPPFAEVLARVREATVGALAHQDVPFDMVVEALAPDRTRSQAPLVDVMFVLQTARAPRAAGGPADRLPGDDWSMESGTAKFDLTLSMLETSAGLVGALEYATDRCGASAARRMVSHFKHLVSSVVGNPDQRIDRLEMLSPDERATLVHQWNATQSAYPEQRSTHDLIAARAAAHPDRVAVVLDDIELSYRALEARANQLAHYLTATGARAGDRIGVGLARTTNLLVAALGIWKAGCVYVPLDPAAPAAHNRLIAADAALQRAIDDTMPWSAVAAYPEAAPEFAGDPADLAYIIYTSGSTGTPKGVMVEHRSLVNYLTWVNDGPLQEPHVIPAITRPTFDASLKQLFAPLVAGRTVWLVSDDVVADPDALLDALPRFGDFTLNCVPWLWTILLERVETRTHAAARCLKRLLLGGEDVSAALLDRTFALLPDLDVWNLYGPTEATANATAGRLRRGEPVNIGRPIANMGALVLDSDGAIVPVGVIGELHLFGAGLSRGYWQQAALTAQRFVSSRWRADLLYKTGDRARYLESGCLELLGRTDGQLKMRGFRIEPREVEACLERHAAVSHAVVSSSRTADAPLLVAYVEQRGTLHTTSEELRRFASAQLPAYMVPARFVITSSLPRTRHGKIDLRSLSAVEDTAVTGISTAAAFTDDEFRVAELWRMILRVDTVHPHSTFFELGGHSLLLAQLMARIADAFGVEVTLRDLFDDPTLAGCARAVARARERGARSAAPIRPLGRPSRRRAAEGAPVHADEGEPA